MLLAPYEFLEKTDDYSEYKFISSGPNGDIVKVISFQKLPLENLYNLSLSDKFSNGQLSDTSFSNNNDLRKILVTTVEAIVDYTVIYPERMIFFQGSDEEGRRIALYQMVIAKYFSVLNLDFEITVVRENF